MLTAEMSMSEYTATFKWPQRIDLKKKETFFSLA